MVKRQLRTDGNGRQKSKNNAKGEIEKIRKERVFITTAKITTTTTGRGGGGGAPADPSICGDGNNNNNDNDNSSSSIKISYNNAATLEHHGYTKNGTLTMSGNLATES